MKKALKILIPLLLSAAVICSMAWYFLVYDRAFTKDLLLWSARTLEQEGKHDLAAWLYNVTYEQASYEDDIAIELSNQYKAIGNYTKAEYTIAEAIEFHVDRNGRLGSGRDIGTSGGIVVTGGIRAEGHAVGGAVIRTDRTATCGQGRGDVLRYRFFRGGNCKERHHTAKECQN